MDGVDVEGLDRERWHDRVWNVSKDGKRQLVLSVLSVVGVSTYIDISSSRSCLEFDGDRDRAVYRVVGVRVVVSVQGYRGGIGWGVWV